jgi:dimethylhistidine N-methyltransferase
VAPCAYVPIDISGDFLRASAGALQEDFPDLPILPLEGDFMRTLELPEQVRGATKLGFFPGSTIGNMVPRTAVDLLRAMKDTLGSGAWLLIGMDRIKDVDVLLAAYDDAQGITAQFNLNLLHRINAELEGDIDVSAWRHRAIWNDARGRIEMHLEAVNATGFTIAGQHFAFAAGETIHTENSHKYGYRDARLLLLAPAGASSRSGRTRRKALRSSSPRQRRRGLHRKPVNTPELSARIAARGAPAKALSFDWGWDEWPRDCSLSSTSCWAL